MERHTHTQKGKQRERKKKFLKSFFDACHEFLKAIFHNKNEDFHVSVLMSVVLFVCLLVKRSFCLFMLMPISQLVCLII